jgi:hypothetical protein
VESSAPAVKTTAATATMEAPTASAVEPATAPTAVESAATTASVESSAASTAVTAALSECGIGRESKDRESSERDEGSNLTRYAHDLTFPSSAVTDFQLQSLRADLNPILVLVQKGPRNPCCSRKPPR